MINNILKQLQLTDDYINILKEKGDYININPLKEITDLNSLNLVYPIIVFVRTNKKAGAKTVAKCFPMINIKSIFANIFTREDLDKFTIDKNITVMISKGKNGISLAILEVSKEATTQQPEPKEKKIKKSDNKKD